jgi:hypothetical protein
MTLGVDFFKLYIILLMWFYCFEIKYNMRRIFKSS